MSNARTFFANYSVRLVSVGATMLSGVVAFPLLVRTLSPDQYGALALFNTAVAFCTLAVAWMGASMLWFGKEEFIRTGAARVTFWAYYLVTVPILVVIICGILLFRQRVSNYLGIAGAGIAFLMAAAVVEILRLPTGPLLQITDRLKLFSLLPLLGVVVYLATVLAMWCGLLPAQVTTVLTCTIASSLGLGILSIFCVGPRSLAPPTLSTSAVKAMIPYGLPLLVGALTGYVIDTIDLVVIRAYLRSNTAVAHYSAAYKLIEYLNVLPYASIDLLAPLMIAYAATGNRAATVRHLEDRIGRIAILWAAFLTVVGPLGGVILTVLAGRSYAEGRFPFAVLVVGSYFRCFLSLYSPLFGAEKMLKALVAISAMQAVVNTALDFLLIRPLGSVGPAVATATIWLLSWLIEAALIHRRLGVAQYRLGLYGLPVAVTCTLSLLPLPWPVTAAAVIVLLALLALHAHRSGILKAQDVTWLQAQLFSQKHAA